MPWDGKRLLGYVETIQLILGVTDKTGQVDLGPFFPTIYEFGPIQSSDTLM